MQTAAPDTFTLRLANPNQQDSHLVWSARNDPETRQNSINQAPIAWEQHTAWYSTALQTGNTLIYLIDTLQGTAGYIRFDRQASDSHSPLAVVSIAILPAFRRGGLGSRSLSEASQRYYRENNIPIIAYIYGHNTASLRAFAKAGYSTPEPCILSGTHLLSMRYG